MHLNRSISPLEHVIYGHYKVVHAVRMALAFVLTFLAIRLFHEPEATWPLITMVVVMGPISFLGNVLIRAIQRIMGTVFGAASGLVALYIEIYSLPLMLVWCALVMFMCGMLALGKRPYMGLLIGITLAIVCGAGPGEMDTALWRSGNVIIGSLFALFFTSIYPQKAFTHWRLMMSKELKNISDFYSAHISPNVLERPHLSAKHQQILNKLVRIRTLISPSLSETHINKDVFDAIQVMSRNLVSTLELLTDAYWATRESHFIILNATTLQVFQKLSINTLNALSGALLSGNIDDGLSNLPEMGSISVELKHLMENATAEENIEAPIYGYVWLNLELAKQLDELRELVIMALTE
ncbi:TPA: FUSC family protein [Salmonella enterica subsp. enterica serovar Stanley]|nr:FUSC family protein [Salmonella enterica]EDJ8960933.1 FUSC family protein [Salmonella enterica subsp. enterica serovar Stanley]EAW6691126.1 FUSC family protein [Salmonella enterica]EBK3040108.1 FUSC family protein [Salmonella enterica]EDR6426688.1 FUSC family protein [Salmonella enterica]